MISQLERYLRNQRRALEALEAGIQLDMLRSYEDAIAGIEQEIRSTLELIRAGGTSGVWQEQRLRYLESRIERYLADWQMAADKYMRDVVDRRAADLSRRDFEELWRLMSGSSPTGATSLQSTFQPRFPVVAFEQAVMMFGAQSPLQQTLRQYTEDMRQMIREQVLDGIAQGRGGRAVLQSIEDAATGPYARARLESLVRMEMMRAYRAQNDADSEALGDAVGGHIWSASKSARTCLACLHMDGTFVPIGEERRDRMHVNCRCRWVAVPLEGLDLWLPERENGEQWLRRQPASVLRRMMPNQDARDAFTRGDLDLQDFTGTVRHPVWGESVVQQSGRRALERSERRRARRRAA